MANRLANETSPYLRQHQDNPVAWYPWGAEALERAKAEDKPILVSIGYSACHWCHVMAHESFEDDRVAAVMNERFINIKVDREERPDLDSIYMSAVQAMTGHGGWPLNVFLTPDGVPFFGGTYFPPADRQGMASWTKVLEAVHDAFVNRRDAVEENAEQLRDFLDNSSRAAQSRGDLDTGLLDDALAGLRRAFDPANGGFGGAPKFPQPALLEFLLRTWKRTGDQAAAGMVRLTLDKMANGGMYDQIGGGFHRYAVDSIWLVPHFEKMLYDNAQLARIYLDAYRAFGEPLYRQIATETLDYVGREMTSSEGEFYAAEDADSEGHEGRFYVWTEAELDAELGDDAALVKTYYAVQPGGNFEGRSILHVPRPAAAVAVDQHVSVEELTATIERARGTLRTARDRRPRPGRDEKILTSWNGLMLRAFAEGARVLNRPDFADLATRNATFLLETVADGGRLRHAYKDGRAQQSGFLEDYAYLADGLIALGQATLERRWIDEALRLAATMIAEFADEKGVGFFDTGINHERLVTRPRDLQDGATPSGNAVAADVLLRLSALTDDDALSDRAGRILRSMTGPMRDQPIGFGRYLSALDGWLSTPKEIVVAGRAGDPAVEALASVVWETYEPNALLGRADPDDPALGERFPFLADRPMRDGRATAYVCERFACLPPVTDRDELAQQIAHGTGIAWRDL